MAEEPDNKEKSWIKRHPNLTNAALTVILFGMGGVYYHGIRPNLMYRKVAKKTGRSFSAVKDFYSTIGYNSHWWTFDTLIENISLPKMMVLFEDSEIKKRAENVDAHGRDITLKHKMSVVIKDVVYGWKAYNNDTGIVQNMNKGSNFGVQSIDDYVKLTREQQEKGFFTILASKGYGLTIDELCSLPGDPNESYFSTLEPAKMPKSYVLPLLRAGQRPKDIVEKYAIEEAGVSVDKLLKYAAIKMNDDERLSAGEINIAHSAGMTPKYLQEILNWAGYHSRTIVFRMIENNTLNGNIYKEWGEFNISPEDTIDGLNFGYTKEEVRQANNRGLDAKGLRDETLFFEMLSDIAEKRKATK